MKETDEKKDGFSARQRKVIDLLLFRKCSAADISIELGYSDPRSHIARIIEKGVRIGANIRYRESDLKKLSN